MKASIPSLFCVIIFLAGSLGMAVAETIQKPPSVSISRIEYTNSELESFGFTQKDLAEYGKRLNSIEGKWWGHLSPMEMMMYSAKTEIERRRFAKMYLTSNNPKAQAERKSAIAMYAAAREVFADELTNSFSESPSNPIVLFVNVNCKDCATEVKSFVADAIQKVDIYVTHLNRKLDINTQLVDWASDLSLPYKKVSLNDDNGIFQRSYGYELGRFRVISK